MSIPERGWAGFPRRWIRENALGAWAPAILFIAIGVLVVNATYGGRVLDALWFGSFGSWYAFTSGTLVRAVPLILTGLGVAVAFRAGVFNIGAEGQLLAGATAATLVGLHAASMPPALALPLALGAGGIAGALWAGMAAVLRVRFGVLEVISTLMLNFLAADLVAYLVRGPLQEPLHIYPQSATIAASAHLARFGPATRLHWGFVIAVGLAVVVAVWLARTASGFRIRVVGANPAAALVTGRIAVARVITSSFLISGAFCGLAGAIEVCAVTYALYENLSPGYGFTAIAVAVLADLHPLGVLASGVVFAALETGATAMQRDAGVPAAWASVIEACLILAILATTAYRARVAKRRTPA